MRIPKSLETLVDDGIIQQVLRPLMSGKEAQIYLVVSHDRQCAAKIYKDAQHRSFKHRSAYTEGRKVRNTRDQRAMDRGTKYGKSKDEDAWKSTEVDVIYRLRAAGVRVPNPFTFIDGVLVMELVTSFDGNPAPRLGDLKFTAEEANEIFHRLIREVQLMLVAGVVHGDLSEFNVLMAETGPVVIDFPQAVNAAGNLNARTLLIRDVNNLHQFLARWVPGARRRPFAEEMWALYESNQLTADTKLTGAFRGASGPVDTREVISLIADANRDEAFRRRVAGQSPAAGDLAQARPALRRREVIVAKPSTQTGARGRNLGRGAPAARPEGSGRAPNGVPDRGRLGSMSASSQRNQKHPRHAEARPANSSRPAVAGRRPDAKSRPRRGDTAQVSTYVSPEARKNNANVLKLTPRERKVAPRAQAPKGPGHAAPADGQSSSAPAPGRSRRRRRSRRRTGT